MILETGKKWFVLRRKAKGAVRGSNPHKASIIPFVSQVTMVEASGRPGGRVYTRYEDDYYGDIGAMREAIHIISVCLSIFISFM